MKPSVNTLVFAYHNMGVLGLEFLLRHGFDVKTVFSHEDDPNEKRWFSSVQDWCSAHAVTCLTPDNVNEEARVDQVRALQPAFLFSFWYRHLLSQAILDVPGRGAFNLHGSLLPKYRGCAPVNWVLVNGETETGVTLHHMVRRADAGDIVAQEAVPISEQDTAVSLYAKIEDAARPLLERTLPLLRDGSAPRTPQDEAEASYYRRRRPEDGRIDWSMSARQIYDLVRAVTDPYPGAFTLVRGEKSIIWWGEPVAETDLAQGELAVRDAEVYIGAGDGALRLMDVEWRGERLEGMAIAPALVEWQGRCCGAKQQDDSL